MKMFMFLSLGLLLSSTSLLHAKVIQIIHTNDLHSYFQGTRGGIGGYAQLKKVIDGLKSDAASKGIPSIYLDGGDFGEGSSFYFSNQGVDSLKALDILGVDVTVLGNHDFILGGKELKRQLIESKLKAKILSSNLIGKRWFGLSNLLPDYVDYQIEDLKIRIFGLTTNEIHYMYPLRPLGHIADPHRAGIKQAKMARAAGADFTIALTHIGLDKDILLVQKSRTIDMVVGGHTHIRLPRPQLTKNLEGKLIPIVQAGAHSGYVGSIIFDLQKGGEARLVDYKMINIYPDMPQDDEMKKFVSHAYDKRAKYFGRSWEEVIGLTEIPLSGSVNGQMGETRSCWARHMARVTRKVAKAELGLQFADFQGEQIEPGPVTYGDMIDNFPHFRKWNDKGWKISRAWVSGFVLKKILGAMANSELALQVTIDGVQAKDEMGRGMTRFDPRLHTPEEAFVGGENISSMRYYTLGIPSEVTFGTLKIMNVLGLVIFKELRNLPNSDYWSVLEDHIRKNSPIKCLED